MEPLYTLDSRAVLPTPVHIAVSPGTSSVLWNVTILLEADLAFNLELMADLV